MSFLTRNDEVFLLSAPEVSGTGPLELIEHRSSNDYPVAVELIYLPAGDARARVEVTWNTISEKRRMRGELIDFDLSLECSGEISNTDVLSVRLPFDADSTWDPVFATIGAIAFSCSNLSAVLGVELCFGSKAGRQVALPFTLGRISHFGWAWRYLEKPEQPFIEAIIHLGKFSGPVKFHFGRVFVGQHYDPYIYNPAYEYVAHRHGRPTFPGEAETKAEFERLAQEASKTENFIGSQAFIRPYMVMREGEPRFPMLVGSPNSMSWYGMEPNHGIEMYKNDGYVVPGDVVLDCGAHAGQMSTYFSIVAGSKGRVLAFEPFPQNFYQVEAQARLNGLPQLQSMRAGVGEARATAKVSISGQMTTDQGPAGLNDQYDISILPLDDFLDIRPTFIKLDVEGAEVGALRGAQRLLQQARPKLFIEVHTQFIDYFGHSLTDLFDAIPRSVYNVRFMVDGVDHAWRDYEPGVEQGITAPLLLVALPK